MTRRNDRRLLTDGGEPVRNRETWTVTAIDHDGALTLRRRQGDDSVGLPVEYVREHVRLGYAATEHGYQADTVDTAIALATTATTRRGLYVAMTRGRDRNDVCVVTDTTDATEARDVLDTILAIDRADTPAIVIRRELAQHDQRPQPIARCETPHWFDAYLDQARHDLAHVQQQREAAERRLADARGRGCSARGRRARHAPGAQRARPRPTPRRPLQPPAPSARDPARTRRPPSTTPRPPRARRHHPPRRHRHPTTATPQNDRRNERAGPQDGRRRASRRADPCSHEHTSCGNTVLLERHAVENVDALTTWQHWANGHRVDDQTLAATHRALATIRTPETAELARTIANDTHVAQRPHARRHEPHSQTHSNSACRHRPPSDAALSPDRARPTDRPEL